MGKNSIIFLLIFLQVVKSFSQTDLDFKPDIIAFTNPSWYRQVGKSGKENASTNNGDSIYIEFVRKAGKQTYPYAYVTYKGNFKNGLFHGTGEIIIKDEGSYPYNSSYPAITVYRGNFENGKAHGYGVYSFIVSNSGQQKEIPIFTGLFETGIPVRGLTRVSSGPDNNRHGIYYYSGDVILKRWSIIRHGFGILYVQRTETTSERNFDYDVVDGSFYAGQFFYNQLHGFAIANIYNESSNTTGYLQTILTGAGEIFNTYNTLPVYINLGIPVSAVTSVSDTNKNFKTLFPSYNKAIFGSVVFDNNISYTGQLLNGLPYGLGYIEGKDGYRDYSFWKNGVKMSVEEVLKIMLPDSTMPVPKLINRTAIYYVDEYDKKKKQTTYRVEKRKTEEMIYYGKIKNTNSPEGWGFMFSTERVPGFDNTFYYYALKSFIGEFNGTNIETEADIFKTCAPYKLFNWGLKQWQSDKRSGYICTYPVLKDYADVNYNFTNTIAVNTRPGQFGMYLAEQKKNEERAKEIASRKKANIGTLYLSSDLEKSYVTDVTGSRLTSIVIGKGNLKEGDYVLYNDNFYRHNGIGILATPSDNGGFINAGSLHEKVLVIRGYYIQLVYEYKTTTCDYCKDRPATSTYTGTAYTGRNQINVYQNNSGTSTIVSTPIVNSFSVTVANGSCKKCGNEWKYTLKPINVVRI